MVHERFGKYSSSTDCGGLVGHNTGMIAQCHALGFMDLRIKVCGALVGRNDGDITNCYADGHLGGWQTAGGLVGGNDGTVRNCFAAAVVVASLSNGGLAGTTPDGNVMDSYFLSEADGGGPDNGLGVVLSDAQMKQQASFTGWDFESVWTICAGTDYPRLRWENVDCEP